MDPGVQGVRPGAVVGGRRDRVRVSHARNLACLGDPSAPHRVDHEDVRAAKLKDPPELPACHQVLAGEYRDRRLLTEGGEDAGIIRADQVLDPGRLVLLERMRDLDRGRERPEAVALDHDVHLTTHGLADLPYRLEPRLQVTVVNSDAALLLGEDVERPYLHRRDPFRQQIAGELVGMGTKCLQVVEHARRVGDPVAGAKSAAVERSGTGVIRLYLVVAGAAEELVDGQTGGQTEDVPERDVQRGDGAHLVALGTEAGAHLIKRAPMALDRERVLAEEQWRGELMDERARRRWRVVGLTFTNETLVGVQADEQQRRQCAVGAEVDGLDPCQFHGKRPFRSEGGVRLADVCQPSR